jgi:hypothetical protein
MQANEVIGSTIVIQAVPTYVLVIISTLIKGTSGNFNPRYTVDICLG